MNKPEPLSDDYAWLREEIKAHENDWMGECAGHWNERTGFSMFIRQNSLFQLRK